MKTFCVLISFFIVNVLAATIDEYKEQVAITNRHIEDASEYYYTHITRKVPESGLEYIIDLIARKDYPMEILNLMITVPELGRPKKIRFQIYLQKLFHRHLALRRPNTTGLDLSTITLGQLGQQRRGFTERAIENVIYPKLAQNITDFSYDAKRFRNLKMCRLIGLWMSSKKSSFTQIQLGGNYMCLITYEIKNEKYVRKYKTAGSTYQQISFDDPPNVIADLEDQLHPR